jgi:outer membrane protein assembly factor BamD (BamD/ComL family)
MKNKHTSTSRMRKYSHSAAIRLVAVMALSFFAGLMPAWGQAHSQKPGPREQAAQTLFDQGVAAAEQENPKTALNAFEQVAQQYGKGDPPAIRLLVAKALLNKGAILGEQGDPKGAITNYERVDRRFGKDDEPAIRGVIASALVSKAEAQYKLGNTKASIATYEQVHQRFGTDKDSFVQQLVGLTRWRTAEILASDNTVVSP